MRLYGRWHKRHVRCGNTAYAPRVVKVMGETIAYGRVIMPPRGAALRLSRLGNAPRWAGDGNTKADPPRGRQAEILDYERYWRTPGNRVPRYKPPRYQWASWRLSQGFIGGKWQPSQLRKPKSNRKAG